MSYDHEDTKESAILLYTLGTGQRSTPKSKREGDLRNSYTLLLFFGYPSTPAFSMWPHAH